MESLTFDIIDDSGFLAMIDPDAYTGYVSKSWDLPQLTARFREQMKWQTLLIWGTDMENEWRIRVEFEPSPVTGFRQIVGSIRSSAGRLLLTSYDSLTMAAQFSDVVLPEDHERDHIVTLEPGVYNCRIIQLHDHSDTAEHTYWMDQQVDHYVIEILKTDTPTETWKHIPWDGYLMPA